MANLDLLVPAGVQAPTARRSVLYHNIGDGTFSRASEAFHQCGWVTSITAHGPTTTMTALWT